MTGTSDGIRPGDRWVSVGVRYCVQHHGIANEDDYECDFRSGGSYGPPAPFPCKFRDLGYRKPKRQRKAAA